MEIIIDGSTKNLTNDQMVSILKQWTESKRGRSTKLAAMVFPERNKNAQSVILPSIKSGRYKPSSIVWQKIINGMELVEKQEKENIAPKIVKKTLKNVLPKIKENEENILLKGIDKEKFIEFAYHGFDPSQVTDEMIFSNKQALKNNLYHFNAYLHDKSIKSQLYIIKQWLKEDTQCKLRLAEITYTMNYDKNSSNGFSKLINNIMTDHDFIRVTKIMIKVDRLIENNSPFALAARLSA